MMSPANAAPPCMCWNVNNTADNGKEFPHNLDETQEQKFNILMADLLHS